MGRDVGPRLLPARGWAAGSARWVLRGPNSWSLGPGAAYAFTSALSFAAAARGTLPHLLPALCPVRRCGARGQTWRSEDSLPVVLEASRGPPPCTDDVFNREDDSTSSWQQQQQQPEPLGGLLPRGGPHRVGKPLPCLATPRRSSWGGLKSHRLLAHEPKSLTTGLVP